MKLDLDIRAPESPRLVAVLLHPHPRFGGNRFHPFVDGLHRRLPEAGVAAVRFDFESEEMGHAVGQVEAALGEADERWPGVPSVLAGYSFGAGVAAAVDDQRLEGWLLLAPQVEPLSSSPLRLVPRPKFLIVPEFDQFAPPALVEAAVEGWVATTVSIAAGSDHFLGPVQAIVQEAVGWISTLAGSGTGVGDPASGS